MATSSTDKMDIDPTPAPAQEETPADPEAQMWTEMEQFVVKVAQTAETKEMRFLQRSVRHAFSQYRRKFNPRILAHLILKYFPDGAESKSLLSLLPAEEITAAQEYEKERDAKAAAAKAAAEAAAAEEAAKAEKAAKEAEAKGDKSKDAKPSKDIKDTAKNGSKNGDKKDDASSSSKETKETKAPLITTINELYPECEVFISLLLLVWILDSKQLPAAKQLSIALLQRIEGWNRRTLDPLSAKVYFYYSRLHELLGEYDIIRPKLFALYRTAVLRHNIEGQTSLLNLLLRNYLHYNLYDQANKLISNVEFKEAQSSNNEVARYYYYQGRILALDPQKYAESHGYLEQALRKAPSQGARGFRAAVIKLSVIVQLLMGNIPERSIFRQKGLRSALAPYLQLTAAVRIGDLAAFGKCLEDHHKTFTQDKTLSLINRMRSNVIKIGLRKINLSYSKISLKDVASKLYLDSEEDAEFIVAKAIKHGIIDATIVKEEGIMKSNDVADVYSTKEPQEQFHLRTEFFHKIHNDAMKAMRYRPDSGKKKEDGEDLQKLKDEEELIASLADSDEFDF